jgi:hypothetical protein
MALEAANMKAEAEGAQGSKYDSVSGWRLKKPVIEA